MIYRTGDVKVEDDASLLDDAALLEDTDLLEDGPPAKILKKQSKDLLKYDLASSVPL